MTRANTFAFPQANFIGFNHIWDEIERVRTNVKDNYPPHNVVKHSQDRYSVELAVAGFAIEDLEVTLKEGVLVVTGDANTDSRDYLHKGVSTRKFVKTFRLSEHVVVDGADLVNGLLVIDLKVELPEEKRPQKIEIGKTSGGQQSEFLTES